MKLILCNGVQANVTQLAALALVNYGHFTTLQVRGAAVRGLKLHLCRLDRATQRLFGSRLDIAALRAQLYDGLAAFCQTDASLRITVYATEFDFGFRCVRFQSIHCWRFRPRRCYQRLLYECVASRSCARYPISNMLLPFHSSHCDVMHWRLGLRMHYLCMMMGACWRALFGILVLGREVCDLAGRSGIGWYPAGIITCRPGATGCAANRAAAAVC